MKNKKIVYYIMIAVALVLLIAGFIILFVPSKEVSNNISETAKAKYSVEDARIILSNTYEIGEKQYFNYLGEEGDNYIFELGNSDENVKKTYKFNKNTSEIIVITNFS